MNVIVLFLAAVAPLSAQTRDQNWAQCRGVNPDLTIQACTALIDGRQESPADLTSAYIFRGQAQLRKNAFDAAIADFTKAVETSPGAAQPYFERAQGYMRRGTLDAALADFTKSLEIQPQPAGFNNRGIVHLRMGNPDGAMADFTRAIELDPGHASAWDNRGRLKAQRGDPTAIDDLNRAVALAPGNAVAYLNRAAAKNGIGDFDGGLADSTKAIQLDPANVAAYNTRASTRVRTGDLDGALADVAAALDRNPKYAPAYDTRAAAKNRKGDVDGALADLSQEIELNPSAASAFHLRGILKADRHDFDAALTDLREAARLNAGDDFARLRIWLLESRDPATSATASEVLRTYVDRRKAAKAGAWAMTLADFLLGRVTEDELLNAATTGNPSTTKEHQCEAYFYAGEVRLLHHDDAGARDCFTKSVATTAINEYEFASAAAELRAMKK